MKKPLLHFFSVLTLGITVSSLATSTVKVQRLCTLLLNEQIALHHLSQNVSLWFTSFNHGTLVRLKGEQMSAAGVGGAELGRAKACRRRRRRRRRRRLRLASASLYQTKAEDQAAHHRRVAKQRTVCSV